jgi:hypothetical protein
MYSKQLAGLQPMSAADNGLLNVQVAPLNYVGTPLSQVP